MPEMDGAAGPKFCHWPSWPVPFDLALARSPPEPCPYLPGRAMRVRGLAAESLSGAAYQQLLDAGFRRSGQIYYQPACDGCRACVPLRLQVARFRADRSQRRCRSRNGDLSIAWDTPRATDEKHALYDRYLHRRHDGQMDDDRDSFEQFLYPTATTSLEGTVRDGHGRLLAVGLVDLTPNAVSTVYSFFDPDQPRRSLGTYTALAEIDLALASGRPYYYLGYWIADCRQMVYKSRLRPCEALCPDGTWREMAADPGPAERV